MSGITTICGVDFSGARLAGRNIWIARASVSRSRLRLRSLDRLEDLCGSADRDVALAFLVDQIAGSRNTLWGIDFPFGLPIELFDAGSTWTDQLNATRAWQQGAHEFGLWCLDRARKLGDRLHIRRTTDVDVKTPFDCYHYRIIYQTFHGMRDVLHPLISSNAATILPFHSGSSQNGTGIVVEACPSSTLKRLKLPHQNYKQPEGGPLLPKRLRIRRKIVSGIERHIVLSDLQRRTMMRNPGGDALDAVIAAVGTWQSWTNADHDAIARHERYPLEGFIFA